MVKPYQPILPAATVPECYGIMVPPRHPMVKEYPAPRWLHYFRVGNGCIVLESATAALFYLAFVVTIASEDRHICGFWVEGGRMPGILGGLILKLPDNVTLTQAFTARKTNRPVIGFFHRVSLKYVLAST